MKTHISKLRGINVSGHNLIKMDTLLQSNENLGLYNAETYLQSGNVIFKAEIHLLLTCLKKLNKSIWILVLTFQSSY